MSVWSIVNIAEQFKIILMEQWTVSFTLGLFEAAIAFVALSPSFIIVNICELGVGRTGFHPTIFARGCKVSNPCAVAPQGCSLW